MSEPKSKPSRGEVLTLRWAFALVVAALVAVCTTSCSAIRFGSASCEQLRDIQDTACPGDDSSVLAECFLFDHIIDRSCDQDGL